jgi:general secretion pathway protein A
MVLVGQPEFAAKLELPELRQVRQRVAVRSTLVPFTESESLAYIEHRLSTAGGTSASVFTRGALREVVEHAKGVPRVINILCDNALVNGLGCQKKPVTAEIVREAILDLTGRVRVRWPPWAWASLVTVVAAGALFLASPYRVLVVGAAKTQAQSPALPHAPPRVVPEAAAPEASLARSGGNGVETVVIVGPGDSLSLLAKDVYGFADERVMRVVLAANPDLGDPDRLLVGTPVHFPAIPGLGAETPPAR